MKKLNLIRLLGIFLLSQINGCTSTEAELITSNEYNKQYHLSYNLKVDEQSAEIHFLNSNQDFISKIVLPNKEDYIERKALQLFCDTKINCSKNSIDIQFISWSPDKEFLAIFIGHNKGLWFVPAKDILTNTIHNNKIIKIGVHQKTNQLKIGLFHKLGGWVDKHQFIFSAGLYGSNFIYQFDPKEKLLKGFPFDINEGSTITKFSTRFIDDFPSHKTSFNISEITKQLEQLK